MHKHFAFGLTMALGLAALAPAQSLDVPDPITAGSVIKVTYENPAKAGQPVTITIAASMPELVITELVVVCDSKGRAFVTYVVPDALSVMFNAPGCKQVTRFP